MNTIIREIKESEYAVLEDFLYHAIYVPEGSELPRSILSSPDLQFILKTLGV